VIELIITFEEQIGKKKQTSKQTKQVANNSRTNNM